MSAIPLCFHKMLCSWWTTPRNQTVIHRRNYPEYIFQCPTICLRLLLVYFTIFHAWNECKHCCFHQSTYPYTEGGGYANRSAISYPTNNTLVVPPNYMKLFMSIPIINRVWNDLYALYVYLRIFVLCDSSFDHFTA